MTREAYQLLHQGTEMFARVEHNGIKVDEEYLDRAAAEVTAKIALTEKELLNSKEWKEWKKRFGDKAKITSREQLGVVLFDVMNYEPKPERTATNRWKADNDALIDIDSEFVQNYIGVEKWRKVLSTNLNGLRRELCNGFVHCSYNLASGSDEGGGARSYRSSCSAINFQNQPVRDPEVGAIVRKLFIPRKSGWVIGESDYSAIEVKVGVCYHKDPAMIRYIEDKATDMHRDTAVQLYFLKPWEVPHEARHASKNMFVFPQFYGSYYLKCARALWMEMRRRKTRVCLPGDNPKKPTSAETVVMRLARKGITELGLCRRDHDPEPGTFEYHVQKVERDFWERRFKVFYQWKKDEFARYLKRGYFTTLTGFCHHGIFSRNQVGNYGTQGSASHCQCQSMIWIQKELRRQDMETLLIGTIHDSIIWEGPPSESADVRGLITETMTKRLPREWPWIIVPLEVEHEVAPPGESWHAKKKVA